MDEILTMMQSIFSSLGINVAGCALYDFIKTLFRGKSAISRRELKEGLESFLAVHGVTVSASTIIRALAERGILSIQGSQLYAPNEIEIGANLGARFVFGNNSSSRTDKSSIVAEAGANITGSGASITQESDGSIVFRVGKE